MSDELKGVLAVALPVGFLLVGAMVLYGPGAKIEGAGLEGARSRARRRKGPRARRRRGYPQVGDLVEVHGKGNVWYRVKVNDGVRADGRFEALPWAVKVNREGRDWRFAGADEDLSQLRPGEINRRLDRLDKLSSKLTDEFIAAGRGSEKPSETWTKGDALALRYKAWSNEHDALHAEIARRYGPGAPSRMPTRVRKQFGLGYPTERHVEIAEAKRQDAVEMLAKTSRSLAQRKCNMAVLQLAQAQRKAGEAYAHAEDHVPDRHAFYRLEDDAKRMTATVAKVCRGYKAHDLGAASNAPRVYEVTYVEDYAPERTMTARIVADTRLSKAELQAKLLERDVSPAMKIVKVRSEAI